MAKERLSQVQKAILLTLGELIEEQSGAEVRYRWLVKQLAVRGDRIHERSGWMIQKFLVTVSRSIRNMEKKGLVKLHFSFQILSHTFHTDNIHSVTLTKKGKKTLKKVKEEGGWANNPWLERNLQEAVERRKMIAEFNLKLKKLGIRLP